MLCFISVQLSKLPDAEQNTDFPAPFSPLPSFCFQFCFAVGFSLLPGSYCLPCFWFKMWGWSNLPDFVLAFAQSTCLHDKPPVFTDGVSFCLQKRLPLNVTPHSLEYLILKAPCIPPVYHGDSSWGNMFTMELGVHRLVMLWRKYKQLCTCCRDVACSEHQMCENL